MVTLRLLLGDQLTHTISSLQDVDIDNDVLLMCEVVEEASYVKHHQKKIAFLFSAMRHFAQELRDKGYNVVYVTLNDKNNTQSFGGEVERVIAEHDAQKVVVTFPGEYRVLQEIQSWEKRYNIPVEIREDDRFLSTPQEFAKWAKGRKQLRMEYFYREIRKKYSILMNRDKPIGSKWNYDAENRKPPKNNLNIPQPYRVKCDKITTEVLRLVEKKFSDHFGDLKPFHYAVTREKALGALEHFIEERLVLFGDYQDAMLEGEPWMYHSHISLYLNCGLLTPLECVQRVEKVYHEKNLPLNAVEGFIRQIIGWREYVRGIYWLKMPEYKQRNFLNAKRKLPRFYWDANTDMNCLKQCVTETKNNAYAHHIQRLMVLGNFALIAGIHPDEVNEWYLLVYADAYEWVELPNVSGMILFADGGYLASKPYAASGSYINKMSNYCKNCRFKVSKKNGEDACPFNYLYWDFLIRNQDKLENNHRIAVMYRTLARMKPERIEEILSDTQRFFENLP